MGQPVYGTSAERTANTYADGVDFTETDTGRTYLSLGGGKWVLIRVSGAVTVDAGGSSGVLFTKTVTINGADDLMTDPTSPVAAELITVTIPSGKKRCRLKWHCQQVGYVQSATSDIPWAAAAVATINAGDDTIALSRLTVTDSGVGDHSTSDQHRMVSGTHPEVIWDTQKDNADITRLDIGAIPSTDTGAIPVYLTVEAW